MDKEKVKQFIITQRANGVPDDQIHSFLVEKGAISPVQSQPEAPKKPITEKILDFTGGKELGQGLGQAAALGGNVKRLDETLAIQNEVQQNILKAIKENRALGKDTSQLEALLQKQTGDTNRTAAGADEIFNPNDLTPKEVIGDALQLGTTLGTIGGLSSAGAKTTIAGKAIPGLTKTAPGIAQNLAEKVVGNGVGILSGGARGALAGAGQGAISGTLFGTAQGLQNNLSAEEISQKSLSGGVTGLIGGGILGGLIGGVSGGLQGRALRKEVLNQQVSGGEKTTIDFTKLTPKQQKSVEIARQQGIDDVDTQFIQSMKPADKIKADKMISLAEKASVDKRVIERPIDIVGDSMLERVKFIENQNKVAGSEVNAVAKSLRGQVVDANPVAQKAKELIDDLGVQQLPNGKLNFSNSVFKNTPELQKKLQKFIQEVPAGQADAYDVHIFKKSIDELVDYGTKGEGLKGNSERILKALRSTADDVLDNTFEAYNAANTDFRVTKQVLDEAKDLFGKKTGFGKERGGQLLRSVFSNNTQRPRVLKLVENLDNVSKAYGKEFTDNLVDQALFTEILEDIYGTQATTSLQGQVGRAVKGTQKVLEGIRDPIKGLGEAAATIAEKTIGVSPENKKKILKALLSTSL